MKNLKLFTFFLVIFTLTSCSTEEGELSSSENEKATISFGALLNDLNVNRNSLKQAAGDIPACSDDTVVYVEIILSSMGVDVVGTEGAPFRVDLVAGQLFTEEVTELKLDPGNYSLDYFTVHSMDGTVIWVAPIAGSELAALVDNPLPINIPLGAGVKKYVDVSVLCLDDRMVNEYGYLFFELDATKAIQFCIYGNYCDESGRHYPMAYSIDVWNYNDGQMGSVLYSGVTNTVELNDNGEYASSPVCFYLPDSAEDEEYYFQITLLSSDAYGTVTESIIKEGVVTDYDVRSLHIGDDDSDYYHLRYGCGTSDTPVLLGEPSSEPPVIDPVTTPLTDQEEQDLLFLREEEKLARDVYLYSYEKYGTEIFRNIIISEQNHMASVLKLLKKYNIEDPALEIGVFVNSFIQEKYYELIAQSDISELEALLAGDYIEDMDIWDLTEKEKTTTKEDLLKVYGSLKCGSRNHLRSFNYQVELNGGVYVPQFITVEEFESIVNSGQEICK